MGLTLNGFNLKEIFDVITDLKPNPLMAFPGRKDSTKNDFLEQNGLDIDLSAPFFSARTFVYSCICSGATIDELKQNYWGFFKLLSTSGASQLYDDVINMLAYVYYVNQSNLGIIQANNKGGYSIPFDIQFGETDPTQNVPTIYLVDGQNRFLVP